MLVYLVSRAVSTVLLVQGSARQVQLTSANFPFFMAQDYPAQPGYLDVIMNWDGQYYLYLALDGYGSASANDPQLYSKYLAWAFPPGFPLIMRGLVGATGGDFAILATVLNLIVGGVAMVLLFGLVRRHADMFTATAVVATTSFFVSAPLFQMAYTESLGLLLLVMALRDIDSHTWWRASVWIVLLSLVRIVTPPLAIVALIVVWAARRTSGRWSVKDVVGGVAVAIVAASSSVLWTVITRLTPRPASGSGVGADAASDRTSNLAVLTVRWVQEGYSYGGVAIAIAITLVILVCVLLPLTKYGRSLGPALSTWLWAYPLFLFTVTIIQPGMIRYLLLAPGLLVPLFGPLRRTKVAKWVALVVVVALLVVAQKWFVDTLVVIDSLDQGFGP